MNLGKFCQGLPPDDGGTFPSVLLMAFRTGRPWITVSRVAPPKATELLLETAVIQNRGEISGGFREQGI